jgi:hypothetical protein
MPYTSEKIKLSREQDRRVKLTEIDKEDIKHRHKAGEPIHAIARAYKGVCSRRMIQFVIFPERLKALQEKHIEEKRHLKYYDKDKWRETMRDHRAYKQGLYLSGSLKPPRKN